MQGKEEQVSIIIPIYNGEAHVQNALSQLKEKMGGRNYEIIIAEDGSTDRTLEILARLAPEFPQMRILSSKNRLGRGKSLSDAIVASKGEISLYMDVDAATEISEIFKALEEIRDADIVTGSRLLLGSHVSRSFTRELFSRGYNLLIRFLFNSKLHDHQCGFKAFRKSSILPILPLIKDRHWFWDTELLVLAQRKGLRVKEIPVEWKEGSDSTVRVFQDAFYMFKQMALLFFDLNLKRTA